MPGLTTICGRRPQTLARLLELLVVVMLGLRGRLDYEKVTKTVVLCLAIGISS